MEWVVLLLAFSLGVDAKSPYFISSLENPGGDSNTAVLQSSLVVAQNGTRTALLFFGGEDLPPYPDEFSTYPSGFSNRLFIGLGAMGWREVAVSGAEIPSPRSQHAAVVLRDIMIVYGGRDALLTTLGDMYVYHIPTATWRLQQTSESPGPLRGHKMVAIGNTRALLFGGRDDATYFNKLFELDVSTWKWTELNVPNPPSNRAFFGMAANGKDVVLIAGGLNSMGIQRDVFMYNTSSSTFSTLPNLGERRFDTSAVYVPDHDVFVVSYGTESLIPPFWASPALDFYLGPDFTAIERRSDYGHFRAKHASVGLESHAVIVGGRCISEGTCSAALSPMVTLMPNFTNVGTDVLPSNPGKAPAVYDPETDSLYHVDISGGEVWSMSMATLLWRPLNVLSTPVRSGAAFQRIGRYLILNGGSDIGSSFVKNDTFLLNIDNVDSGWQQVSASLAPSVKFHHLATVDDAFVIRLGGVAINTPIFDPLQVFKISTQAWSEQPAVGASSLHGSVFSSHQVGRTLFVYTSDTMTGEDMNFHLLNLDTWTWLELAPSKIPARMAAATAMVGSQLFLHGGKNINPQGGAFEYKDLYVLDLTDPSLTFQSLPVNLPFESEHHMFLRGSQFVLTSPTSVHLFDIGKYDILTEESGDDTLCQSERTSCLTPSTALRAFSTKLDAVDGTFYVPTITVAPGLYGTLTIDASVAFNAVGAVFSGHDSERPFAANLVVGDAVTVTGATFRNGYAQSGGCVDIVGGEIVLRDIVIDRCRSDTKGGGVAVTEGTVTLEDALISQSASANGGGMYLENADAALTRVTFTNCEASRVGGGINAVFSTVVLTDCNVSASTATLDGGACYLEQGTAASIFRGFFHSNSASTQGGAVACLGPKTLTLADVVLTGNTASALPSSEGGAVYSTCPVVFTGLTVTDNSAGAGGGLYFLGATTVTGNLSAIHNNVAGGGGGLYASGTHVTLDECDVSGNTATTFGGGILAHAGLTINGASSIAANMATAGGGIYWVDTEPVIAQSASVSGNVAIAYGPDQASSPKMLFNPLAHPLPAVTGQPMSPWTLELRDWYNNTVRTESVASVTCSFTVAGIPVAQRGTTQRLQEGIAEFSSMTITASPLTSPVGECTALGITGAPAPIVEIADCLIGEYLSSNDVCIPCERGKYSQAVNPPSCQDCPAGFFSATPGATNCTACPPGTFSPLLGSFECQPCGVGSASALSNASVCPPCAPGMYASSTGSLECRLCPEGSSATLSGSSECTPCPANFFAAQEGTASCEECDNSITLQEGSESCVCEAPVMYGVPPECLPCPDGASCTDPENILPLAGHWRSSPESVLFYDCPNPQACAEPDKCKEGHTGTLCDVCEENYKKDGKDCTECTPGGTAASMLVFVLLLVAIVVAMCGGTKACTKKLGGTKDAKTVAKAFKLTFGPIFRILIGLFQVLAMALQIYDIPWPSAFSVFLSYFSFVNLDILTIFNIGCITTLNFYGRLVVSTLTPPAIMLAVVLTAPVRKYLLTRKVEKAAKTTGYDLQKGIPVFDGALSMESEEDPLDHPRNSVEQYKDIAACLKVPLRIEVAHDANETEDEEENDTNATVRAPTVVFDPLLWLDAKKEKVVNQTWTFSLLVLVLVYPAVSSTVLQTFSCRSVDGVQFLVADITQVCFEGEWVGWGVYGGIMIAVYPIGVPVFFAVMLTLNHKYIFQDPATIGFESQEMERMRKKVRSRLGFIFNDYGKHTHIEMYFELVDMMRKLVLSGVLVFLRANGVLQVIAANLVCVASLVLHAAVRPYEDPMADVVQACALLELFMTFFIGMVLREHADVMTPSERDVVGALLIIMAVMMIVFAVLTAAVATRKLSKKLHDKALKSQSFEFVTLQSDEVDFADVRADNDENHFKDN